MGDVAKYADHAKAVRRSIRMFEDTAKDVRSGFWVTRSLYV